MSLNLIRKSDTVELYCRSDEAADGEGENAEWVEVDDKTPNGTTLITIHGLSDWDMSSHRLGLVKVFDLDDGTPERVVALAKVMAALAKDAFSMAREGAARTSDARCIDHLSMAEVIALGSKVLELSRADPTSAGGPG